MYVTENQHTGISLLERYLPIGKLFGVLAAINWLNQQKSCTRRIIFKKYTSIIRERKFTQHHLHINWWQFPVLKMSWLLSCHSLTLREQPMLSVLNDKVLPICELALDVLIPVTNHLPPGEPGAQVDQARVLGPWCSKELVGADVTLVPTCGEVPVRQRKGLVAHQALQRTEMH